MGEKILVTRSSMPPFDEYMEMIKPLWESHWLTNMGTYHKTLERELKEKLGVEEVALTCNGHLALELAIQSMNFPRGSEVITTPFTFISTTHAIIRNGLEPVFCDIKDDYTIDEERIEDLITEKTVAIVPVHVYGNPCNVDEIEKIAFKYGLKVIYDAAHAFGEVYKGKEIGMYGDLATFSFHATKVFNTIEGGAVCCRGKIQYDDIYNLKNFGIRSEELVVSVGANAKMNEFAAAMGICNLRHLDEEIKKRKQVMGWYRQELEDVDEIKLNEYCEDLVPNYAYLPIRFRSEVIRNMVYDELRKEGIFSRKYFYPLTSDAACFKNKYKKVELPKAREASSCILVLPLYADLLHNQVIRICEKIKKTLE